MLISLIRPPILVPANHPIVQFTPPLGIAYLAGSLRAGGFQVIVIDGLGEALDERHPADNDCYLYGLHPDAVVARIPSEAKVIGISASFSFEWPTCRDLIRRIKEQFPHVLLVAGGEHITALPELCLEESELDICILGEGEEVFVNLLSSIVQGDAGLADVLGIAYKTREGKIRRNGAYGRIRNLDEIPLPAWDVIPIGEYLDRGMGFGVHRGRSMPVLASRGCPFQCTFCSSPQMWTTRWLPRNPDLLLDELEYYQNRYHVTNFDFYDLTAIVKKSWIVEFCQKIAQRNLKFTWQLPSGTRSEAIDQEVAEMLYASGCRNLSYSPESGSPSVLKRIKKQIDPEHVLSSIQSSVESGLNVKVNLIIGFPGETYKEIFETLLFVLRLAWVGAHDLSIWVFSPYPGSELFAELSEAGVIKMDVAYYDDLRSYADSSRTKSFTDNVPSHMLKLLRRAGTAMFYMAAWSFRPWRPFIMLRNVVKGTHESRSERALSTMLKRYTMKTGAPAHNLRLEDKLSFMPVSLKVSGGKDEDESRRESHTEK